MSNTRQMTYKEAIALAIALSNQGLSAQAITMRLCDAGARTARGELFTTQGIRSMLTRRKATYGLKEIKLAPPDKVEEKAEAVKPALGVMPRWQWLEMRAVELSTAIAKSVNTSTSQETWRFIGDWCVELRLIAVDLENRTVRDCQ